MSPQSRRERGDRRFGTLIDAVAEHGGEVVKFAGDSAMALWRCAIGDDVATPARLAARGALAAQQRLDRVDVDDGETPIRLRLGVGSGDLVESISECTASSTSFNDVYGLAAAFILAVIMAVLFIFMVFERPDLRGLSYPAAWLMLIGNVAAAVFCYYWWPLQFEIDRFGGGVAEPKSYLFLYLLYVIIPLFNGAYIYLLHRRRRELRETRVG